MGPVNHRVIVIGAAAVAVGLFLLCAMCWGFPPEEISFADSAGQSTTAPVSGDAASADNTDFGPGDFTPKMIPLETTKVTPHDKPTLIRGMVSDSNGDFWIATEDDAVFRYEPETGHLQQFTTRDGLGDNSAYAIAIDHQKRIWVGHQNHGVSVYDGRRWQNYDLIPDPAPPGALSGPIGERVFSIAVCPTDGDVWIATSAGLTRYSVSKDSWSYITRAQGLPSNQVQAMAFDPDGNLYAGTQCDGLAIAQAADHYKTWRQVTGPDQMPTDPMGDGLPGNLINDVLVAPDGIIYVATTTGLAGSADHGKTWHYVRGKDWIAKVKGLNGGPPANWTARPGALLAEDYTICVAEDNQNNLWVGHWRKGWEEFQKDVHAPVAASTGDKMPYVLALLPQPDGSMWAGCYPEGLLEIRQPDADKKNNAPANAGGAAATGALPSAAKAPTLNEFNAMLAELMDVKPAPATTQPMVVALDDDWRTQGTWTGRYGKYWACLCAMTSQGDYIWGTGSANVFYDTQLGPNHRGNDSYRLWVEFLYGSNPRSLEIPPVYLDSRITQGLTKLPDDRRESDWNDHGEGYPLSMDGPDLYCTLRIPQGIFDLSIYEMNKDGQGGTARQRDSRFAIRWHDPQTPLQDITQFNGNPELAHSRVVDFWNGVYKRFRVEGPVELTIEMKRNGSGDAMINGLFLDKRTEKPEDYCPTPEDEAKVQGREDRHRETFLAERLRGDSYKQRFTPAATEAEAAERLFSDLREIELVNPAWYARESRRFYLPLLRWYLQSSPKSLEQIGRCYYELSMYDRWEQCLQGQRITSPRQIEKSLKWDGHSDYSGKDRETVEDFLKSQPGGNE